MKIAAILMLMILFAPSALALTAAIGNARVVLNTQGSPEDPAIIDRTLKVINKNDVAVKIHLNPSIELRPFINVIDNDFVLQPGEEKEAAFVLTIDRGGTFNAAINVLFSPVDPESKENEVGLASKITIISEGPIIEDPNEQTEEGSESTEETQTPELVPEGEDLEETEEVPIENDNSDQVPIISDTPKSGANPLVGIVIMAAIIALGAGIFIAIVKLRK